MIDNIQYVLFFHNITHYKENRKMVNCSISVCNGNPIPLERNKYF